MNNKEKALTELKRLGWSVIDESSRGFIILEGIRKYGKFTVHIFYRSKEVSFIPYYTYDYIDFESLKYINQLLQEEKNE